MEAVKPKVSIILPVYNAGKYLDKCITHLINQTLKEIEIIIVLDCPTDGSDAAAKEFAKKDRRIKIIENEENLRVGLSRNKGIDAATGEYIGFCDHDDYAGLEMYECLYTAAVNDRADVAIGNYNCVSPNGVINKTVTFPIDLNQKELTEHLLITVLRLHAKQDHGYGKFIWHLIFKKDFLDKNNLRFDDNKIITSDDCLFLSKIYFLTDKVIYCDHKEAVYHHVGYHNSTQHHHSWMNINLVQNYIMKLDDFLKTSVRSHNYEKYIAEGAVRHLYSAFRRELKHHGIGFTIKSLQRVRKNAVVHYTIKPLFSKEGLKYLKHLPPTKLVFMLWIYI